MTTPAPGLLSLPAQGGTPSPSTPKAACSPSSVPPPPPSGVRLREESIEADELLASVELGTPPINLAESALDPADLRRIIAAYLPLVRRLVRQLKRRLPANVQCDDLIAAGVFGLVDSLRRNGGDHGVTFQWYARTRIRGAIFDELRAQDWLSRRTRDRLTSTADATGNPATVFISLDEVTVAETHHHFTTSEEDPFEALEAQCQQRALARAIEQLPERERTILGRHYFDGVKLKDIGVELGVGEARISQLHSRALGRLRALLAGRPQSLPRRFARPVSGASMA
jgi:RNA polymerase sigma factor FliA